MNIPYPITKEYIRRLPFGIEKLVARLLYECTHDVADSLSEKSVMSYIQSFDSWIGK